MTTNFVCRIAAPFFASLALSFAPGAPLAAAGQQRFHDDAQRSSQTRANRSGGHNAVHRREQCHGRRVRAIPWLRERIGSRRDGSPLRQSDAGGVWRD